jgi:8-hydroxy-5-deazaflavin:NADPH oxidoreductase
MKIGFIGAGVVGQTLASKLAANGHDVMVGIRTVNEGELAKPRTYTLPLDQWLKVNTARVGTFAEAAAHGDIVFNVTSGGVSIDALNMAGADNLSGKILIDVANPLDFSRGMPPSLHLGLSNSWSLGEEIQKRFPGVKVVKAFNTVAASIMVDPKLVPGPHDLFICGNDAAAKDAVKAFAYEQFGWQHFADLGDIVGARGQEAILLLWVRHWGVSGSPDFNFHIAA